MNTANAECNADQVDLRWDGGTASFKVEVVDTFVSRSRGLMFRETLGMFEGMLFVYPGPQEVSFWMKNTLLPLDMIFLDRHGVVQRIHENAIPGDLTSIPGGKNILTVLEINGGLSAKLRLKEGAQMRHPAYAKNDPVWPCD